MIRIVGLLCILIGLAIIGFILYRNSPFANTTRVFSSYALLHSSWEKYKQKFINNDGRVVDYDQNQITTSEGQSYVLLRSVWIDDKATFDFVWDWTQKNMQRSDGLFGWQWGKKHDGGYGILPNGGENPATDADSDIALALILASHRWHQAKYQNQAKKIIASIWNEETATASGKRYLIAGPWANGDTTLIVNPSYFAPYAWRIFAKVDTSQDWNSLIGPAYTFLTSAGNNNLDKSTSVGLPPDWIAVDKKNGTLMPANEDHFTSNYSFDAMRTPWRIAVDYIWNNDPRAKNYLENNFRFLKDTYDRDGMILSSYSHDGLPLQQNEIPVMYATALGYFIVVDSADAQKIYQGKIIQLYSNDNGTFKENLGYYDQNWLWFGAALYNHYIVAY